MSSSNPLPSPEQLSPEAFLDPLPDERLAHLVREARRGLARVPQNRLAEHGIAFGHWTFLRILWQRDSLTQRQLSELAGVMEPTTFSALQAMERLGYVRRERRPDNRKNVYVVLTAAGRELEQTLVPIALEINEAAVASISAQEVAATRRTLLAIIRNTAIYELNRADEKHRLPSARRMSRLIGRAGGEGAGSRGNGES